jgi:hypothetical protein
MDAEFGGDGGRRYGLVGLYRLFAGNFTHFHWQRVREVGAIMVSPHKNAGWQPALRMARDDVGSSAGTRRERAGRDAGGTGLATIFL